jgi:hypothetical protein
VGVQQRLPRVKVKGGVVRQSQDERTGESKMTHGDRSVEDLRERKWETFSPVGYGAEGNEVDMRKTV